MYGMQLQDSEEIVKRDGKVPLTKKFTRLFSKKHHPRVALIFRYVLCFMFGGIIGLIPYFIFLVELCKGLQYSCIQEYAASLAVKNVYLPSSPNGDSESLSNTARNGETIIDNFTKFQLLTRTERVTLPPTSVPTTLRTTLGPTRIGVKERTVEGKGNDDISIQCRGTMKITRVLAFGIVGDTKTVTDFDHYCRENLKDVDNTKVCIVSLKRVYKTNYPPFISTKVTYKCTYVTRDKAEGA